jgi:hypothetical protein
MTIACAFGGFAYYVIRTNKDLFGKPHHTTVHGKLGVFVLLSYLSIGIVGLVCLHPDWGILKTNKSLRFGHKWGGRILTALAWITCCLGFNTMESNAMIEILFALPLLFGGFFILL